MTNFSIYVLSKNRPHNCLTANLLIKNNIKFNLVIEESDYKKYKEVYKDIPFIILDQNDKGLSYARTFTKKYSQSINELYHWQLDDDILFFSQRINNKNIKSTPLIITEIEEYVQNYSNVALTGLRDIVFAWTQKSNISYNKQISTVSLINNSNDIYWSDNLIEDTDYSLQCLYSGFCTVIFNRILYNKKPNIIADGGQNSINLLKRETLEKNLVDKYYPHFKLRFDKKLNLYKVAPSRIWQKFLQRPKEISMKRSKQINSKYNLFDLKEEPLWKKEWQGMPEYSSEDLEPYHTLRIHFNCEEDIKDFAELVHQKITNKTKFIWYPERNKSKRYGKIYIDES